MADENKVVLVGESGVGKTCIINQFIKGEYDDKTTSTISFQFCQKTFEFPGNKNIALDIWDTAGQEKYRSLNSMFYKNVKAAVLVYDITDKKSFDEIKNFWYGQVTQNCDNKKLILAIAANKCDLYEQRQVEDEEGEKYAKIIGAFFTSTSAKNANGITNLFENIANKLLNPNFNFNINEEKTDENNEIKKDTNEEKDENNKVNSRKTIKLNNNNIDNNNNNTQNEKKKKCC